MTTTFAGLWLAGILGLFPHRAAAVHVDEYRSGAWRIHLQQDNFNGRVSCRITRPHVEYLSFGLMVLLPPSVDTSRAEYKTDGGVAKLAVHSPDELKVLDPSLHLQLINPSAGRVFVPAEEALSARTVTVRAAPGAHPRTFIVEGLPAALDLAKRSGC